MCWREAGPVLKPVGHQPPPCNLCAVSGWSRPPGRARACLPLLITTQLAGSSPGDEALTQDLLLSFSCCPWRVEGSAGCSQDWPTELVVPVACGGQLPLTLGFFYSSFGPGSVTSGFSQLKILVCCSQCQHLRGSHWARKLAAHLLWG